MARPSPMELMMRRLLGEMEERLNVHMEKIDQWLDGVEQRLGKGEQKLDEVKKMLKKIAGDEAFEKKPMDRFPLSSLNAVLLEKVITMLDPASYFLLQQTCHGMKDFIQKSRNISVRIDVTVIIDFDEDNKLAVNVNSNNANFSDLTTFHGLRLSCICMAPLSPETFDPLCNQLQNNQLTADRLYIRTQCWTNEQCSFLLNALKCQNYTVWPETLVHSAFQSKYLNTIDVRCDHALTDDVASRILTTFADINISMLSRRRDRDMLPAIFKTLSTQPPNLEKFQLYLEKSSKKYCLHRMKKLLDSCGLKRIHSIGERGHQAPGQFIIVQMINGYELDVWFATRMSTICVDYKKTRSLGSNVEPIELATGSCSLCQDDLILG